MDIPVLGSIAPRLLAKKEVGAGPSCRVLACRASSLSTAAGAAAFPPSTPTSPADARRRRGDPVRGGDDRRRQPAPAVPVVAFRGGPARPERGAGPRVVQPVFIAYSRRAGLPMADRIGRWWRGTGTCCSSIISGVCSPPAGSTATSIAARRFLFPGLESQGRGAADGAAVRPRAGRARPGGSGTPAILRGPKRRREEGSLSRRIFVRNFIPRPERGRGRARRGSARRRRAASRRRVSSSPSAAR